MKTLLLGASLFSLALLAPALRAQTIQNPSFETNGGANWTPTGTVNVVQAGAVADNGSIPDGTRVAALTSSTALGLPTLSTTITGLVAGGHYRVSCRVNAKSTGSQVLAVLSVAGNQVGSKNQAAVGGSAAYDTLAGIFTATSDTASLALSAASLSEETLLVDDFRIVRTDVLNTANSGPGSLRQALADAAAAPGADVIGFDSALAGQTISLASTISINDAGGVTVDASTVPGITIDDGTATTYGLFTVIFNSNVTFRGLTFANGGGTNFTQGGAAFANGGTLTLERCTLTHNSSSGATNAGGAIANNGTLTLTHCTLIGNSSGNNGGAIYNEGHTTLTHCTVAGNAAAAGGGLYNEAGTLTLHNTIVADNTDTAAGTSTDNISGTFSGSNNLTSGYPDLGSLKDNGGPTRTMALLPGSPALDAGAVLNPVLTTDQRGFDRNRDGNAVAGALPDIGAYEAQSVPVEGSVPIVVTTTADEVNPNGTLGSGISLREALRDAPADGEIVFDTALNGQTITLSATLGDMILDKDVTIDASTLSNGVTITRDATGVFRLLTVLSGKTASLIGLTLTGGEGGGQNLTTTGGAIQNAGTLTLTNCTLSGNSAIRGGAIYSQGPLTLTNCTLSDNQTTVGGEDGGAIYQVGDTLTLTDCTLLNNSSVRDGGAVYLSTGTGTLTRCTLDTNSATNGGAIESAGGLTLTDCTLARNFASFNGSGHTGIGGAIYNGGGLNLTGCTFDGNRTRKTAAAATANTPILDESASGGAIYNPAGKSLMLTNCTFTGNSSLNDGSAIANLGTVSITHGTFAGNFMGGAGGNGAIAVYGGGTLYIGHSIVAGSIAYSIVPGSVLAGFDIYKFGGSSTVSPFGVNLIGFNGSVEAEFPQGPLVGTQAFPLDPKLAALASNGGPTQTMLPLPGSPAIDAAAGSDATTDQRGLARPKDGDGNGSVIADLGAVERGTLVLPVVSTTADGGTGSLRQAFADAAEAADVTITFAPGFTGPIVLTSEIVAPTNAVITVDGSNVAGGVVLDGGGASLIFTVNAGGTLALKGLTLTGGSSTHGSGGAIYNSGAVTLMQCTLSGNSATFQGGAIINGGTLTLTRCTLSGNSASYGGAIYNHGTLTLAQCTLSGNSANSGGAIYHNYGSLTLTNTIVAGNTAPTGPDIAKTNGTITPHGNNVVGRNDTVTTELPAGLLVGTSASPVDAKLSALGSYGGPTQTMFPLAGSPAIDQGDNAAMPAGLTADQRGSFLPFNTTVDIGAVERGYVVTSTADSGANTLRQAVTSAGSIGSVVINFDPALDGTTIPLASRIALDKNLEINAEGLPNGITLDGGSQGNRLLRVFTGRTVALHKLKLVNGGGTDFNQFGGGIINDGKLTLTRCTLSGNTVKAGNSGGAISSGLGSTLALTDCTLSGNSADFGGAIQTVATATLNRCLLNNNTASNGQGGAISGNASTVSLNQCTVANNTATGTVGGNGSGGGIFCLSSYLTLNHCTIAGNTATGNASNGNGGGVFADGNNAGGFAIANTIITGNTAGGVAPDFYESGNFLGGNLNVSFTGRVFIGVLGGNGFSADDKVLTTAQNGPVKLSALGDYGGPTQTMVPLAGSPVLNQASNDLRVGVAINVNFPTDQRGRPRSVGGAADLGAVERTPGAFIVTHSSDSGPGSLRQTMLHPEAIAINFDPILSGETVTLTSGEIVLPGTSNVTVDAGSLPAGLTIFGNNASRIFTVPAGASLTLRALTLTGGSGDGVLVPGQGGALYNNGTTVLERCTFTSNNAILSGGAIVNQNAGATLTATQCTFTKNTSNSPASGGGALANFTNAVTTLTHCTLSGNSATGTTGVGGGLRLTAGSITITNCIVAGNTTPNTTGSENLSGPIAMTGNNIFTGEPLLAPLGSYGGPTRTLALLSGSSARNAATVLNPMITADQRGFAIVGQPDIGAYEAGTFLDFDAFAAENPGAPLTPTGDADGDGSSDLLEYATLRDPNARGPKYEPGQTLTKGGSGSITEASVTLQVRLNAGDLFYTLQSSTDMKAGNWNAVATYDGATNQTTVMSPANATIDGSGMIIVTDPGAANKQRYFYRVQVQIRP